ncbi:CoA pyrophosphatase [Mixta tenebrionis]|uniref:CoA pyrophosphatase n=1 Tax=Mixta tenebrionis TaxID=2562439 RepID=A0A506VB42_9GAMM|nr:MULTISPECIES: CoA pyrophosphatase [Mixta]QHM75284.1 putative Nudix hydrolase NudL [Mixta theicola]TPW43181.1 CoA pyrophosphatase [Mixta tenebrionis]
MNAALTLDNFLTRFQLQPPLPAPAIPARRQAAVLVPIVAHPQPGLLLTRRSPRLRKHAGQVAFPGGMRDAEDASLHVTALREAQEEIGLQPQQARIIGTLPAVSSSTGFQVTPVVAIIPPHLSWQPNADEVDAIFEMPLQEALRLARYAPLDIHRGGLRHRVWLSWYQDYFVWGMTAGIIRQLSLQVMPELNTI